MLNLLTSAYVPCSYCLKNNQWRKFCFALIKFTSIKRYHLRMCNRALLLFEKLPQWNLYVNGHVNGTAFQSGLRFQTGLSSLRVSCKRARKQEKSQRWRYGYRKKVMTAEYSSSRRFFNTVAAKAFLKVISLLIKERQQSLVILITQANIM